MRLSVDDCYSQDANLAALARRVIVQLNGKPINALFADDEAGLVSTLALDPMTGTPVIVEDEIVEVMLSGKVRIIDPLNVDLAEVYLK